MCKYKKTSELSPRGFLYKKRKYFTFTPMSAVLHIYRIRVSGAVLKILRKEVIQPQVPLRLPCYDLVPLTSLTFGRTIIAGLRVLPAWVAWRAVCTRLRNTFTAVCWPAITSDSDFMESNCRLQSELGNIFWDLLTLTRLRPFVCCIVGRVQP